ncbi:GNAT family N-acetyltransferase [Neobacillus muris]|uniref:GNAT family N-acetyltransferase n=1 Tax=Neobacillus muris TaxID=2941334 RepID=UPI00203E9341|nr:GNAT family N-acetyltransferase [Neobacillus muris]
MNIEVASIDDLRSVKSLYKTVTGHLRKKGVHQWDLFYPNRWVISKDLKQGHLHAIFHNKFCLGAIVVNEDQSSKYKELPWLDSNGKPAVIHRLAVHPDSQGKGIGKLLLQHAEAWVKSNGYTSIRLDAYMENPAAIKIYERSDYSPVGKIHYPFRKHPFQCYEKILSSRNQKLIEEKRGIVDESSEAAF